MAALKRLGVNNPGKDFLELPVTWVWSISLKRLPQRGAVLPGKKTNKRHAAHPSTGTGWGTPSPREGEEPSARRDDPYSRAWEVDDLLGKKEILLAVQVHPPASLIPWLACTAFIYAHIYTYMCNICSDSLPPHQRCSGGEPFKGSSVTQSSEDYIESIFIPHCKPVDSFSCATNKVLDT